MASEEAHDLQRFAIHDIHFFVAAIRHVEELLLRVGRERDVERGAFGARGFPLDVVFLDEGAVQPEHLDAIVHAVAYIHQAVVRNANTVDQVELRRTLPS